MFRIYYDDGSVYEGDPWQAPALGVLVIAESDPDCGRRMVMNHDYYWWENDQWEGGDIFGLFDYLQRSSGAKVLFGRVVDNVHWQEIYSRAYHDPGLPAKIGYASMERKV